MKLRYFGDYELLPSGTPCRSRRTFRSYLERGVLTRRDTYRHRQQRRNSSTVARACRSGSRSPVLVEGWGAAFSPDSRWLVRQVGSNIVFLETRTHTNSFVLPPVPLKVSRAETWRDYNFAPDGKNFVTLGESGLHLWRFSGGLPEYARSISSDSELRGFPAFSPDGAWLAVTRDSKSMVVWNSRTWSSVGELPRRESEISSYAFLSSGKDFGIVYSNGEVQLWRVNGWVNKRAFPRRNGNISASAFSPDGEWLATNSDATTINVSQMVTGQSYSLRSDSGSIRSLVFTPDSRTLVAGTVSGDCHFGISRAAVK